MEKPWTIIEILFFFATIEHLFARAEDEAGQEEIL